MILQPTIDIKIIGVTQSEINNALDITIFLISLCC